MIPVRFRASLGYLRRHPWQLALAVIGVAVGVAVIVAVDLANASARKAFLLSMDAVVGKATHQVLGGPEGIPEDVYTRLRTDQGMTAIAPVVAGEVRIGTRDLTLIGVDLFAERALRDYTGTLAETGGDAEPLFRAFLTEPGAVALAAPLATSLGLETGSAFELTVDGMPRTGRLVGVLPDAGQRLGGLVIADIATAQEWLGRSGRLSRIDVRIDPDEDGALARLEAALPPGLRVLGAAGRTQATLDMSAGFMTNLSAMSLLALLVGLFLVMNSTSFSVLQRRPLIGTLRALGVTRRELVGLLLAEAAVIGLVAAAVGIALGVALGERLLDLVARSINDLYFRVTVTNVSVEPAAVLKGLVAGVGAALVGAAIPAWEATGYRPRLALARSVLEERARRALPFVTLAGLAIIGAAVVVLGVSGRNLVAGLAAVFMLISGFSLCAPLFVRVASTALAPLARRLGGSVARMAVAGVGASLSRSGIAVVALAIAVSATIGVSVMVGSFRAAVVAWLDQSLQADLYARAEQGRIDDALVAEVASQDGVAAVSTSRRVVLEETDGRTWLVALAMAPGSYAGIELMDAEPEAVWPAWESRNAVVVSEPYAWHRGVAPGDVLQLPTGRGPREFAVLATYRSYDANASSVLVSRRTFDRWFDDDGIDSIGVYVEDGTRPEDVAAALRRGGGSTLLEVESNAGLRAAGLDVFDRTFVITDVLYWLALGVAFVGVLSAMLALQLERAREIATLRALGMTPAQVGGMLAAQTGLLGFLSGLAALPLGIVMAWVLIVVINRRAFGWRIDMLVDPGILASSVLLAVVAALLAGVYPAWRAGRASPALAMREE